MHTMKTLAPTYNRYTTRSTIYHLLVALLLTMPTLTLSATTLEEAMGHRLEIKQTTTPQESKVDVTKKQKKRSPQTIDQASEKKRVLKETIEEVTGNHVNYAFATGIIGKYAAFDLEEARKYYDKMEETKEELQKAYSKVRKASWKVNRHYQEMDNTYYKKNKEAYYVTEKNWELKIRSNNIAYKLNEKRRAIKQAIEKFIDTNVTSTFTAIITTDEGFDLEERRKQVWYQKEEMQGKRKEALQKYRKAQEEEQKALSKYEDIFLAYEKAKRTDKRWKILKTYLNAKASYLEAEREYEKEKEQYLRGEKDSYNVGWSKYIKEEKHYDKAREALQNRYSRYMKNRTLNDYKGDLKAWNNYKKDLHALDFYR